VHGDDAVEARALSTPDEELLVVEGLQVGLGQWCVDLYTLTLPERVEAPVAPRATPPFEPEPVPLAFEVCVSGVRAVGGCVVPDPSVLGVLEVGAFGFAPVIGMVLVAVGAAPVGVVGLVAVGSPVVVVPVVGGVPGVVVAGVVVADGVVGVGLAAGSLFRLSGSTTSESDRGCRRVSVLAGVLVRVLRERPLAVICGRRVGATAGAPCEAGSEPAETAGATAMADAAA
jgi:hypothetical protein